MGILKNWRERWIYHRNIERNKIIKEMEKDTGEKISPNQKSEATKEANKTLFQRMRKRIAVALGAIGITVGGVALALNSGEKPEPEPPSGQETDIDDEKDNETPKTDREKFIEELQEGVGENTNETEETLENIIDEIIEKYDEKLPEGETLDLGVISEGSGSIGQFMQKASGEKVKEPISADQLEEGQVYIDDEVKAGYYLVNNNNNETIAGVIETTEGYDEVTANYVNIRDANGNETVYTRNPDTYVDLEELFQDELIENGQGYWNNIGKAFEEHYNERLENLTDKVNESKTNDDELEF